jgi:hypothetical protein
MIPDYTTDGLLPPGIHVASWLEFAERFVVFHRSGQRVRVGEQLRLLFEESTRSGIVKRFIVTGSFVTTKAEPNDFDCLLVLDAAILNATLPPFQYNIVSRKMARRMFKGDVVPVIEDSSEMDEYLEFFQTTRNGERMGLVEIQLCRQT